MGTTWEGFSSNWSLGCPVRLGMSCLCPYRTMYWSDWGNHPKIETAAMDGTLRETLVQDNIQWPTGERETGDRRGQKPWWGHVQPFVLGRVVLGAWSPTAEGCRGCSVGQLVRRGSGCAGASLGAVSAQAWPWTTTTRGCTGPTPSSPSSAASGSTAPTPSWPSTTRRVRGAPWGSPASDPPQIPASTCPLLASPGLSHPFSIDIFEDYIYGVTYINNRIFKIHKFGHKAVTNLTSGLNHATDVVLYHQYKQPEGVCGPGTPTLLPLGWEGGARAWYLM